MHLHVADADVEPDDHVLDRKIRRGTSDLGAGPAMSRDEAAAGIMLGADVAHQLLDAGHDCLLTGDMGIANTTAAAALICTFTGADPAAATGRGTGVDDATLARKTEVVRRALERHRPDPADPIGVLAAFGGLEHAALAGFVLGAAATGEDHAVSEYEKALELDLSAGFRDVVTRQHAAVVAARDEVKALQAAG